MIKYLVLISYLLITNNLYSKIPLLIDSISYENERAAIDTFVHNFRTETDSIRLQKYICFPEFSIRSGCMLPRRGLVLSKMSDRQIRKYISKHPSDDPFYYWRLKYDADNRFRKHLELNNISIEEYCYRDEQCRIAMCGYLIRHFKFSSSAECCVNACVQGHSAAEVGSDSFIKIFSKVHDGLSHHTIPPTTFRQATGWAEKHSHCDIHTRSQNSMLYLITNTKVNTIRIMNDKTILANLSDKTARCVLPGCAKTFVLGKYNFWFG